ncbi:c-type cytochrome [Candidatus Methylospira mobilis]|uniref:C-type cytochrome n=1 Tax=Candidatus Methylospira mobilis TaxID=1808979 RepID=A0A5Q0BIU9_9GAMM|nr:c-type cytochrome [Candidatus Methylospira mobilis]QFY43743.1 c-type cytochrome [Candidatus Methylospira mobilis]WNV04731.1 c-type cytochrome [Candidatus Methylospira mobilis]
MRTVKYMGLLALLLGGFASLDAVAADDADEGRKRAQTCEGCHAIEGYSNAFPAYQVPRIGGQHAEYVVSALKSYQQNGSRVHGSMEGNSAGLSEQDYRNIAAYVSKFRGLGLKNPVSGNAVKGKEKAGMCAGCHGEDGNTLDVNNPRLAGQHESYLIKALKEYKSGARKSPVMNGMSAMLDDSDIVDVAAYYASQSKGLVTLPR